ncbi:MAG TPA: hypothetical protein VEI97_10365, partial [bacterium]|nr:hypothetical protein [bacterium]
QPGGGDGAGWDDVLNGNPETTLNYPQGFNALAQGGSLTDELHFNLDGGTLGNFATDLVLLASYIGAADGKPTRLTSRYFMPEGAIQQSPHIEVDVTAPGPDAGDSGVLDITAVDFQQFAPVNPDPVNALQTKDYAAVWSDGRMDRAQVTLGEFIGGTNDFYSNPGDQPGAWNRDAIDAAPGRGTYAEPKLLNQGFVNTGALAGTFRGGIKISDSRQGVAILDVAAAVTDPLNPNVFSSITGLKKDLNVFNPASVVAPQELATYQFFTFTIAGGTSGGTGIPVVSGAVGRANPNFPNANYRNGIAVRNTDIYIPYHWQGDDDSALFVVRSADLGQTWGTPVRVPADAIANTNFEGSTSGWSIFTNTDTAGIYPVLVGIDADEDVVLISGRPTDVNSTDWPANANHRAEVLAQGTGRSFSVSAGHDYNLNGRAWIVINRRETDPATVNQVVLYRATDYNGSGTPTVTRETAANNGVLDDGPSGTSSRFDADLITDTSAKVHVIWKDAGDNYLEYRSWDAANMVLSPVENILGARTITGNTQPNISLVAGDPIVTFVGTGTEVISDAETMDRDVWLVRRTGAGWSTPVMVNTDDADLNETDPDLFPVVTGGGLRVGVVYEAANADGKRAIHFAGLLATDFTDIVRQALTPDPSGIIDRLDPKIIGVPGSAFAVWESKGEGIPMQGAIITP